MHEGRGFLYPFLLNLKTYRGEWYTPGATDINIHLYLNKY
jgi:hypothetical protein